VANKLDKTWRFTNEGKASIAWITVLMKSRGRGVW